MTGHAERPRTNPERRYWPVVVLDGRHAARPAVAVRLPVPSRAFTPLAEDLDDAQRRIDGMRAEARDAVTLIRVAQALEEIGRRHAGEHPTDPACDWCYWLSKATAAARAGDAL